MPNKKEKLYTCPNCGIMSEKRDHCYSKKEITITDVLKRESELESSPAKWEEKMMPGFHLRVEKQLELLRDNKIKVGSALKTIKTLTRNFLSTQREEVIDECIKIIQTHPEGEGNWCDTGEDMEWSCRDKCVELAVERLTELKNKTI